MKLRTKSIAVVLGAVLLWLALTSPTEAGPRRRFVRCPPPVCCPCPVTVAPPVAIIPTPITTMRVVTAPSGRVYRLLSRNLPAQDEPEIDEPSSPFDAKVGPNDFQGKSRRIPKTSYVEGVAPTTYNSITALKATFTVANEMDDVTMHSLNIPWGRQPGADTAAADRRPQEKKNVIVTAYIYAFKYQGGPKGDHDFHIMVGDAPGTPDLQFLNVEITGLPQAAGPQREKLKAVRDKFKSEFGLGLTGPHSYEDLETPQKVRITGSLFYDMDHSPPRKFVSHGDFNPRTAWEIHPITEIEFLDP